MARIILWMIVLISFGISAVGVFVDNLQLSFEFKVATLISLGVLSLCEAIVQSRNPKEAIGRTGKKDERTEEIH